MHLIQVVHSHRFNKGAGLCEICNGSTIMGNQVYFSQESLVASNCCNGYALRPRPSLKRRAQTFHFSLIYDSLASSNVYISRFFSF